MTGLRYPNQQLRSVSLEAFFHGRMAALVRLDEVQDAVAKELPHLFVPNVVDGEALALRPYQLRDREQTESLAVAINQVSYVSFRYPGHTAFLERAVPLISTALAQFGVLRLERVAYRYDNQVSVGRGGRRELGLERILSLKLPDGDDASDIVSIDLDYARNCDRGVTGLKVWTESANSLEVLRFNVGATIMPAGEAAELSVFASSAHEFAVGLFERLITPEFRAFISEQSTSTENG